MSKNSHIVRSCKTHDCSWSRFVNCFRFLHDCDDFKLYTDWSSSAAHTRVSVSYRDVCTVLVSPVLPSHTFTHCCLMQILMLVFVLYLFRYWLPAGSFNSLEVHVLRSGEQSEALWERSGAPSTGWEVAEVTVSSPAKFHVSSFLQWCLPTFCQWNSFFHWLWLNRILQHCFLKQFMPFTRWRLRHTMCQAWMPQWKSTMFLWEMGSAVLQAAVTLSQDNAAGSTSPKKMDMTGCWPVAASRVHQQTTLLRPQRVWPQIYLSIIG